jgi:hypothetical protein
MVRHKDDDGLLNDDDDANRDPITKAPGAHPVGVGLGTATGGAAAGAAGGAVAGPAGAAVGAVVGGIAGGLIGKGVAESVNPTVEDAYWRETYISRPYVERNEPYETYQPAYRYGWENYPRYRDRYSSFDEAEPALSRDWDKARGKSSLTWERAKGAVRDAWDRIERAMPGDADNDGR